MTPNGLRSFAAGIIFATILFACHYYFFDETQVASNPSEEVTDEDVLDYVQEHGYILVSRGDYEELLAEKTKLELQQMKDEQQPEAEPPVVAATIKIEPGMTSKTVALLLEENKIIEDANAFEAYLKSEKLTTKLRTGTYNVASNMTFAEITKLFITKK